MIASDNRERPNTGLDEHLLAMSQQMIVVALTLGCALKATAHTNPEQAKAIEENLQLLMADQGVDTWQPRAQSLLDLMYSALQERSAT